VSASDSATGTPFAKVGIPLTPMLAYPLAEFDKSYFNQHALVRVVDATDFRPSRREAVMGLCRWLRTVCESVGERWRGEAGRLSGWDDDSAHSLTPMLAHILARAVDANGFGPSRSGGETVPVAAHSCESVGERRHTGAVFFLTLCTTSEIGYTQYKCSCARCMHSRMQLSSLHLNEDAGSAGFFSEDCFHGQILTVWEAYP
jgi:hypothetical protein